MKLIYSFLIFSAIFLVSEIALRTVALPFIPAHWRYKIQEKQAHCYDSRVSAIRLCPNVNQELCHPLGYCFQLTTNARGERTVSDSGKYSVSKDAPVIWAIGDSLTMGFGINDEDSLPYRLSESGFQVRNLASDSLGAVAIYRILDYNLSELSNLEVDEKKPDYLVWVFSRSDFLDDEQESIGRGRWIFQLGKISAWMNVLRAEMESYKLARDANDYKEYIAEKYIAPEIDHPTILAIEKIRDLAKDKNIEPIIILAPDWNPILDHPVLETEYFQFVHQMFLDRGFTVIDLTKEYEANKNKILWLENDGHPNPVANEIFKKAILNKIN
ncbi:MAG: hypothetical protein JJT78_02510 [Leptospira sp.]|nr:hypothetical protein [Leptospira sp.]